MQTSQKDLFVSYGEELGKEESQQENKLQVWGSVGTASEDLEVFLCSVLSEAAGLPICALARPAERTAPKDFLWEDILFKMCGRFCEYEDLMMPVKEIGTPPMDKLLMDFM